MKILRPVDSVPTESLLNSLESLVTLSAVLGLTVGISLAFLLTRAKNGNSGGDVVAALAALVILGFLLWANRYVRKVVLPELRKRCEGDLRGSHIGDGGTG